jgi:hypothetical protein
MLIVLGFIALLLGLVVLGRVDSNSSYPRCDRCLYDLTGLLETDVRRCPECGEAFSDHAFHQRTAAKMTRKQLIWGIVLLAIGLLSCGFGLVLSIPKGTWP